MIHQKHRCVDCGTVFDVLFLLDGPTEKLVLCPGCDQQLRVKAKVKNAYFVKEVMRSTCQNN